MKDLLALALGAGLGVCISAAYDHFKKVGSSIEDAISIDVIDSAGLVTIWLDDPPREGMPYVVLDDEWSVARDGGDIRLVRAWAYL